MEDRPTIDTRMTAIRKGQFDVEIVQAVQARKVLYDKSHEHHKNPRVKEVEWQRIADELQVPSACVIKRWTVIRERFASEKRKVQALGPSSWWLMNHMEWLDVHIQPRQLLKGQCPKQISVRLQNGLKIGENKMRGKFDSSPSLSGIPNLTHISALANFNTSHTNFANRNSNNSNVHYVNLGEEEDSRSMSPIMSIAYPEVCMKNLSSDEEEGSYNSLENQSNHQDTNDNEKRARRSTHVSEDSSHGPLVMGLDLDEAAAARMMASLKSIEDPLIRHRYRQKLHHLAEECELAGLQNGHRDKRRKEV